MVRLVFRPYTQIRRWICTSQSLRASTRVSPGFALLRHSSPSFGSQQVCSCSDLSSENHDGVAARVLAYMLDSLVRVSRRVGGTHFVSILAPQRPNFELLTNPPRPLEMSAQRGLSLQGRKGGAPCPRSSTRRSPRGLTPGRSQDTSPKALSRTPNRC
jgi:hypothetical protein